MKPSIVITIAATLAVFPAAAQNFAAPEVRPEAVLSPGAMNAIEFTPMTRSERLRNYVTGTFGPNAWAGAVASAGVSQLSDRPTEWGQGTRGFADRLGNAYAKHIIRGTLQYGASSLLHEDDRYLRSGKNGFLGRTGYAVSSTFLSRRDNGERTVGFARMGGAAGAAFISRAWQPASTSGASSAAASFGVTIAVDLGRNLVREFWPDVRRRLKRN